MVRFALVLAAVSSLAGCNPDNLADDEHPPRPGGVGPGFQGGSPDGGGPVTDGGNLVSGHVCVLDDLRNWTGCASAGAGGLTVTIGSSTAMTAANGDFMIARPAVAPARVTVMGPGVVPSNSRYNPLVATIDAFAPTTAHWNALLTGTPAIVLTPGNGSAVIEIRRGAMLVPGATVISSTPPNPNPFYDADASATAWQDVSTQIHGKALVPDVGVGDTDITALGGTMATITVPIAADEIGFDVVTLP